MRLEFLGLEGHPYALADLAWASWGGGQATGSATLLAVDCEPDCAEEGEYPAHVVLRRLDSKCGTPLYRKLLVIVHGEGQYFPLNCPVPPRSRVPR
jgi:hypothetical protein